jgi:hypothetical protein
MMMAGMVVAAGANSSGNTSTTTNVSWNLVALMVVGVLALGGYTAVYLTKGRASATFSRIFALIVVAILAVGLGFAGLNDATTTAGYTLLGTIAGYLAGTRTQTAPVNGGDSEQPRGIGPTGPTGPPGPTGTAGATAGAVETFL